MSTCDDTEAKNTARRERAQDEADAVDTTPLAGTINLLGSVDGDAMAVDSVAAMTEAVADSVADAAADGRWTCVCTLRSGVDDGAVDDADDLDE